MELYSYTIIEIQNKIRNKEVSVTEVIQSALQRIEQLADSKTKAFITVTEETALNDAKKLDEELHKGNRLPLLAGVPMAVKDNICIEGVKTTCASKILENFTAPYSATVVEKLKHQKAIFLGKLNMEEFAMSSSAEILGFFREGAATGVADGEIFFALGSDTGGSIRQSAALCGVVGLKPTYGRVSKYGLITSASSLDQIGPITKTVKDAAIVLEAISGQDFFDPISSDVPVDNYQEHLCGDIKGLKIGIPKEYFPERLNPHIKEAVLKAAAQFENMGAVVEECSLPHTEHAVTSYYIIASAEASSNLARFDGVRYGYRNTDANDLLNMYTKTREEGFGAEVKKRILLGTYALSVGRYDDYFLRAQKVRTLVKNDFDKVFGRYDCLLTPVSLTNVFNRKEKADNPLSIYLNDLFTVSANMAGLPALSIPCGFSEGLPIGLQLIGKAFDEKTILRAAYAYEQSVGVRRDSNV